MPTQYYELDAYLGDFADEMTDENKRVLQHVLDKLAQRWPSPDFTAEATEAGNAATRLAFGDSMPDEFAAEYRAAREAEQTAWLRLTGAIVWTALAEPTLSEQAIADRYGVTRMTVRKALAKG